ncbi:hypothetical protein BCL79_2926 [Stenotrophomonas rhizophila]|uniref:Uncharacterized protein n=1 Tax=Stenotrophomonas rhizophila TaxID=216778 RepID=A0A498C8I7_9GAMM|nr:hypothetical protein BCL79_2926 [Stenotrophomonas rhizophila]
MSYWSCHTWQVYIDLLPKLTTARESTEFVTPLKRLVEDLD